MSQQKPNHVCKNINCKNGVDGKPKEYWACNDCDKIHSYREVACCPECYKEYIQQVFEARNELPQVKQEIQVEKENETLMESAIIDKTNTTVEIKKSNVRTKISEKSKL